MVHQRFVSPVTPVGNLTRLDGRPPGPNNQAVDKQPAANHGRPAAWRRCTKIAVIRALLPNHALAEGRRTKARTALVAIWHNQEGCGASLPGRPCPTRPGADGCRPTRGRTRETVKGGLILPRILVTGGGGFIGSHLVDVLMAQGHEVLCLDNFFTGCRDNVRQHLGNPRFELIRHDVVEPILLEVDRIFNLACPASPVHYQYNPVKTVKTNVLGTLNMLGLAKRIKARILQASTSEVYGDPQVHPQPENYWGHVNPIGLRSCYDEGKRLAETLMMDYHRDNKVDVRIVRIFNTYGPRMALKDGRVVSNLIVQALTGQDLTIYGDGSQTRSFCYISDLVRGLLTMMEQDSFTGPVNLGNPVENTMLELAEAILRLTGSASRIVHRPLPPDDPAKRRPDISLAREKLAWEPLISLDDGLGPTIAYFRERLAQEGVHKA
ncbi:MAG: SDR family oxidoreductase [Deltaproteobacteria bacterium]|nr:SDR family oxidoreductase [Deltaproteobacteria bacterium]